MTTGEHWQGIYADGEDAARSWFEDSPQQSLRMIEACKPDPGQAIIDVGGGSSRLVDALLQRGFSDVTVLDTAPSALAISRRRLGAAAQGVHWITADITRRPLTRLYRLWHDRAVFHFLVAAADRAAYIECMSHALPAGSDAIIAVFAADGPQQCSSLPVQRYDVAALAATLGNRFQLLDGRRHTHVTPSGAAQAFTCCRFRRN